MSSAFRVGGFVITSLVIFAAAVFWIGSKQYLFTSTYPLNADFRNVVGLTSGAQVRVGGVNQGTVKFIKLPPHPDGKVRVAMELKSDTNKVVKKDSVAAIRSEGLVGDRYVEVSFGSDEGDPIHAGDVIQAEEPLDISDLMKKANGILDSVEDTTEHVKSITAKINQGSGTAGAFINDRSLFDKATSGVAALQEDAEALKNNFFLRGFFKNRGYSDASDLTKHEVRQLPAHPPVMKFDYEAGKLFDKPDTAKLKSGKPMTDAGKFLESNRFGLVVVACYGDSKGDTEKLRELTAARAMVAREYLISNFKLDDTRIKTIGLGKSLSRDGKPSVEILIYAPGIDAPPSGPPPKKNLADR